MQLTRYSGVLDGVFRNRAIPVWLNSVGASFRALGQLGTGCDLVSFFCAERIAVKEYEMDLRGQQKGFDVARGRRHTRHTCALLPLLSREQRRSLA
jgi:hypothetical protein